MLHRRRVWRALVWAFGRFAYIFLALQLLLFLPLQWRRTDRDRDVVAYHLVGERIERGESMYEPHPPPGPHRPDFWYYLYPPFLAAAIALLPPLPFETFARVWLVVLLAAFWAYAACLCRLATGRVRPHGTLVAGAVLGITPGATQALNMGQADVLRWPMIGAALAFPALTGAGFAAAAMTKVFGVWPLLVSWLREGRRVLLSAVIAVAAGVLLASAALGPAGFLDACIEWFRWILPSVNQGQFLHGQPTTVLALPFGLGSVPVPSVGSGNLSLSFAPLTLARALGWDPPEGPLAWPIRAWLTIAAIAAPLLAAWLARRQPPAMQYALVTCATFLFSPIFRLYNLPVFLAPAALMLRMKAERGGEAG